MKKLIQLSSFLFLFLYGCSDANKAADTASENDIDAARNFIRAALDGDYDIGKKCWLVIQPISSILKNMKNRM
jgi:hypothetical protein